MNHWPGNYEGLVQLPRLGKTGPIGGGAGSVPPKPQLPVPTIQGYFDGLIPANDHSSDRPPWDGKFPVVIGGDSNNFWQGYDNQGSRSIDLESECTCQLFLDGNTGTWHMRVGSDGDFGCLWVGFSPTLAGVYTFDSGQSPAPPATLTVIMAPGDKRNGSQISCSS